MNVVLVILFDAIAPSCDAAYVDRLVCMVLV